MSYVRSKRLRLVGIGLIALPILVSRFRFEVGSGLRTGVYRSG